MEYNCSLSPPTDNLVWGFYAGSLTDSRELFCSLNKLKIIEEESLMCNLPPMKVPLSLGKICDVCIPAVQSSPFCIYLSVQGLTFLNVSIYLLACRLYNYSTLRTKHLGWNVEYTGSITFMYTTRNVHCTIKHLNMLIGIHLFVCKWFDDFNRWQCLTDPHFSYFLDSCSDVPFQRYSQDVSWPKREYV